MTTSAPQAMQVEREDLNEVTVLLKVTCSEDQVRAGFQRALKQLGKNVRIPGFRPGKAPAAALEKAIPEQHLFEAAADEIVQKAYQAALKDIDIEVHARPVVDLTKLERTPEACEFSIKLPLKPIIELGEYKGLPVQKPVVEVTDEEVTRQIDELRRRGGKQEKVTDRGIQEGDMAVVNIKLDGDESDGRSFMTIAGQTFAGLDETILGMKAEEMKHANLEFPGNFQEKDWASSKHECTVTIRSVSAVQMPELDDEFAKSLRAADLTDLQEKVRAGIERAKTQMLDDMVNEQLMDALAARSRIVVATTTWEQVADRRLQEMGQELQNQKSSLKQYAEEKGMTPEELVEALRHEAKVHVERAVMIEEVFRREEMKISDGEAQTHFMEVAEANGVKPEQMEDFVKNYRQQIQEEVLYRAMHRKVMGLLSESASVSVLQEDAPAPAPKKKAAKKKAE